MTEPSSLPPPIRPGSPAAWLLASRPATLSAAVVPVLVGAACAHAAGRLLWLPTLIALFAAIWIQIGTNLVNDVADFESGADTEERMGPLRAAQSGLLTARQLRVGIVVAFGLATAAGTYLTWLVGWPIVVIGFASLVSAIAYTAGPFPLGYHGLGDLFVLLFFGFVAVCGIAYINLLTVPASAWWAALVPGALATNILVVNNIRDRVGDAAAGKRTLVARFGRRLGELEYVALLFVAHAAGAAMVMLRLASPWVLLPLLTLPLAGRLVQAVRVLEGRELNPILVATARLMVLHGVLFAVGLALGA